MAERAQHQDRPTFDYVSPDDLRFDPANPRFGIGAQGKSQDAIQALLEREPHFALQLVDSFLENGFIDYEPLVVRRQDGNYVVVEGNRRLAAIRHILQNRDTYASRSSRLDDLNLIPVLIFPERPDAQDVKEQRVYLGVRHLFGFREWPPDSKARYLDMHIKSAEDLTRLSRELNIRRTEIRRYLIPYRLRKQARDLWEPHRDQDFWLLGEGLNRSGIREYLELKVDAKTFQIKQFNKRKFKHLLEFIYGPKGERRITETRQLSTLAKALSSPAAAAELERGESMEQAQFFIETSDESLARLKRMLDALRILLRKVLGRNRMLKKFIAPVLIRFDPFEAAVKQLLKDAKKPRL